MTLRNRKLLGTVLILVLVVAYPLAVMAGYAAWFTGAPWWAALLLLAALGLLWFFPASWVIRWMSKPD